MGSLHRIYMAVLALLAAAVLALVILRTKPHYTEVFIEALETEAVEEPTSDTAEPIATHSLGIRKAYTAKIAGVRFDNEDGSSRQEILQSIVDSGDFSGEVSFHEYIYDNAPAIYVLYNEKCIGNIPIDCVQEVLEILKRPHYAELYANSFIPEDEEQIVYYGRVTIYYEV